MTKEDFFKRYTYDVLKDSIGGGSFGTVYKAKDNYLHRTVAIKVSQVKIAPNKQRAFSLKDEFDALSHVPTHPNIANYEELYSFESQQGVFDYAVMQYYPDGNLSEAIKRGLTEEQKEEIAKQLLEGIAFLHNHKVVHRDLKPGNILVVKEGEKIIPIITDFGLSKSAVETDGSVFGNSFVGGTQRYSSPEQLQGQPLRFNTDLWSYGTIVYELFSGHPLFEAKSETVSTSQVEREIYEKIVHGDVKSLQKMPEIWRKVAERCLIVNPEQRVRSADTLFSIINGEDIESDNPDEVTELFGENQNKDDEQEKKSKKGLWIGIGIVAVAIAAAFWFFWPSQNAAPQTLFAFLDENDKWGFIDKDGAVVIAPQYASAALNFSEGLAYVKTDTTLYGYINTEGDYVIAPKFTSVSNFNGGIAKVWINKDYGFIDKEGNYIIDLLAPKYDEMNNFSEGFAAVKINDKWGYIDTNGKIVIQPIYDGKDDFHEGLAAVKTGKLYGYIDKKGDYAIPPKYANAKEFKEGLAAVKIDTKWGYIDVFDTIVISPQYDYAFPFSEGVAVVKVDLQYGLIDPSGNYIVTPQYEYAENLNEGLIKFRVDGKYGVFDKNGKIIVEPLYNSIDPFHEGLARVVIDYWGYPNASSKSIQKKEWGYINKTGDLVYVRAMDPQTEDFLSCKTEDDYRVYIDRNGNRKAKYFIDAVSYIRGEDQKDPKWHTEESLTFKANSVSIVMKRVEGGTFLMGTQKDDPNGDNYDSDADNDENSTVKENPVHSVTLSSYYIGETEVTQALWLAVMDTVQGTQNHWSKGKSNNHPAYYVNWNDIQEFLRKLNKMTGMNFRLPTEAEWEYAAKGGNKTQGYRYAGSNDIGSVAWYNYNSEDQAHTVKGRLPNELGLYDMSGNVHEFCNDYLGHYQDTLQTNPKGPQLPDALRVLRGGSCVSPNYKCRTSSRWQQKSDGRYNNVGFRLVFSP